MKWTKRSTHGRPGDPSGPALTPAPPLPRPFGGIPAEAGGEPVPDELFDGRFYRKHYPQIVDLGVSPREHFARTGRAAGHAPSAGATYLADAIRSRARTSQTPMADLLTLLPVGQRDRARDAGLWERLRSCVHPDLYAAQLDLETRGTFGGPLDVDAATTHFLAHGARAGLRVSALFNPGWYAAQLAVRGITMDPDAVPMFHWLTVGWNEQIVPTPLFDEAYYRDRHAGVRGAWAFPHYLATGCYQARFRPSPLGPHHSGEEDPTARQEQRPLLLREMLHRSDEYDLSRTSWLEEGCRAALSKLDRLGSPTMRTMIDKAAALEPLVTSSTPLRRAAGWPPRRHHRLHPVEQMERLRHALGRTHVDTLLLVPDAADSPAVRAAAALAGGFAALQPAASLMVLATDNPGVEPAAFLEGTACVVDVASYAAGIGAELRTDLLLDVVRGLGADRVVTVESRLGWELFTSYARQLAARASLGAYLFGYVHDEAGNRTGFPAGAFEDCFAHLDWVVVDSPELRGDLVDRYVMSDASARRLVHAPLRVGEATTDGRWAASADTVTTLLDLPRRRG
ncbi:hypothetical protein [Nocardioides terrisoli]|uniref:hypothetical protein n=1 Tax=Nocardioides terrisoli TaxID=3388267 RepID=UPI00287B6637|nr:hypothetical protein [Nocardioides marmorisolisilvae]